MTAGWGGSIRFLILSGFALKGQPFMAPAAAAPASVLKAGRKKAMLVSAETVHIGASLIRAIVRMDTQVLRPLDAVAKENEAVSGHW
jgi:hypothetical protein